MQSMMMAAKLPARFQDQVVIQGGYHDDTKELWREIWNTLMGYINADDSPNKLQQKDVLVDLMSQFLSRVAHDSKFYLPCTPAVLRASFEQANFQPLSAAQAFEALHEYAIRILAQPWRAEFTKINMYSGYYVHTVQSRLLEAHRLLEEMGFQVDAASQTATLREPVDADQVTKAAIDTLMASVECRIIERVLESLPAGAYTPLGVLCYRASYVGGVEAAVHHLNVTLRQRNFQRYFSPPAEAGGGGGGGGGGQPPVYPWQPVPPATHAPLPPVPTARLVDVGDRDTREGGNVWIPKTIRHQRSERSEQRSPAAAALLPATLDEHQLASWDLVDGAAGAPAGQSRHAPPPDSLDDSWGYVLNSLDRRRPASGRYDNVPELAQRDDEFQRSATLPTPRAEPRAPPRGGRGSYGAAEQRQPYASRPQQQQQQQHGQQTALLNGSARRLPAAEARSGAGPEPAATRQQQQQPLGPTVGVESIPPRPPPPTEHAAPQRPPPAYEYGGDSGRLSGRTEHQPAPRGSLPNDHSAGTRIGVTEHGPTPRAPLPTDDYLPGSHQSAQQVHQTPPAHSVPDDPQPAPRPSVANDVLVPRSSSLVNDHSKAPRPTTAESFGPRSAPATEVRGCNGGNGYGSDVGGNGGRRPVQRLSPSPEPAPAARPRGSPPEPRRPELGAWPTRPEPAPAPTPAAPEEQWSCHACTYLNPVSVRVCGMCGKSRQTVGRPTPAAPVAAPQPADPPDDLACPQCTLLNSRRARKCGACEADLQPAK